MCRIYYVAAEEAFFARVCASLVYMYRQWRLLMNIFLSPQSFFYRCTSSGWLAGSRFSRSRLFRLFYLSPLDFLRRWFILKIFEMFELYGGVERAVNYVCIKFADFFVLVARILDNIHNYRSASFLYSLFAPARKKTL